MVMSFNSMQSTILFSASTLIVEVYQERFKRKQVIDEASARAIKLMQQYEMFMV